MLGYSRDTEGKAPAAKPEHTIPEGFQDEYAFLSAMRKDFYDDIQFDRNNREAGLEDLTFLVGDQWAADVKARREASRKPTLTVNRLPAFAAQIVGARRQQETQMKVLPDAGGSKEIARIREGLMRSIQKGTLSKIAYDNALAGAVMCGIGNFQVVLDYSAPDVFEQDIRVEPIADHMAVVWDRMSVLPHGGDAKHCFVVNTMRKSEFYKQWPWATASDLVVDVSMRGDLRMNGWIAVDDVRVVDYWRMCTHTRTLALMGDTGETLDITDIMDPKNPLYDAQKAEETLARIQQRADGSPVMRDAQIPYAEMYKCSGLDILEGPYVLPISRVPVFRVPGWEVRIGEWVHRWGVIRFAKDPQRLHNFFRSVVAEKLMQSPRAVWLASDTAVQGREKAWRESHLTDDPLLIWNAESGAKPERPQPVQMEAALIQQAEMSNQDIKDVTNIHEANLGMPSNEVSGAAIMARQRVSDTGSIIYHDNLNMAQEEAGGVINQLIPVAYDTYRVIKIEGEDGKRDLMAINEPTDGDADKLRNDITAGKYSVACSTGPSTETKRIEASENMMALVNAMPQTAAIIADLLVEAQDWPMAQEIARRLRMMLPPGIISPQDMSPEEQQVAMSKEAAGNSQAQIALYQAVGEFLKTQSEAAVNNARARNFTVQADLAPGEAMRKQTDTASQAAHRQLQGSLETIHVADNS